MIFPVESMPSVTVNKKVSDIFLMQINALYESYKGYKDIMTLYCQPDSASIILIKDGFAIVYVGGKLNAQKKRELESFLQNNACGVFCERKLRLNGFFKTKGSVFLKKKVTGTKRNDITTGIGEACDILSEVFDEYKSSDDKTALYCDISHRVRHGISKVYSIKGASTLTAYCKEINSVLICDAATRKPYRGKGYFKLLLSHMAGDCYRAVDIYAASRDKTSDKVYKKLGFKKQYKWYLYKQESY